MVDVNSDAFRSACDVYNQHEFVCPVALKFAIQAYEAAKPSGWLPIESAPRDGKTLLMCCDGFEPVTAYWSKHFNRWTTGCDPGDTGEEQAIYDACPGIFQPDYWQPLPTPPVEPDNELN